jgi:glutathione S-transferase
MGIDTRAQALIEQWNRRMELLLFGLIGRAFQNTSPLLAQFVGQQFRDYGSAQLKVAQAQLEWLDKQLSDRKFIAVSRYTITDITAQVAIDFGAQMAGLNFDPALANVSRWHKSVSNRPSASV